VASPEAVELRARTDEELQGQLEEAHQALFNLRFQAATRQLADVKQVGRARRQVARIKTLMRERSILIEADAGGANPMTAAEVVKPVETADAAAVEEE
jgi:large subunit ribosomal protein L29